LLLKPMLASLADASLEDPQLVYEPKYDGIRAIAEVPAGGKGVHLWSRLGNEKTAQFPEVAAALSAWASRRKERSDRRPPDIRKERGRRPSAAKQHRRLCELGPAHPELPAEAVPRRRRGVREPCEARPKAELRKRGSTFSING